MTKYNLVMTTIPCKVAGGIISIRPTYACVRAFTYLLTLNNQCPLRLAPVARDLVSRDFSTNDLSPVPLPLVGPKIINVRYR